MGISREVLAIDPGPTESAWLVYEPRDRVLIDCGIDTNGDLLAQLRQAERLGDHLAIEMIACYGMPVGAETFETCRWIGKFEEAWLRPEGCEALPESRVSRIYRKDIKLHLCGTTRAKDANVRQALLDRFGGSGAVGTKKNPGPLYGVKSHLWAALAVAVTWADLHASVDREAA